jgi:hypothetical protein
MKLFEAVANPNSKQMSGETALMACSRTKELQKEISSLLISDQRCFTDLTPFAIDPRIELLFDGRIAQWTFSESPQGIVDDLSKLLFGG